MVQVQSSWFPVIRSQPATICANISYEGVYFSELRTCFTRAGMRRNCRHGRGARAQ